MPFGDGLADSDHDEFYICSQHPCVQPADPTVAVGPDDVVQTAGALIRVTRRNGTGTMTASTFDWFAEPDDVDGFGDVSVAYHPVTDRYFGASTHWYCGPGAVGYLDLAVSETAYPRGPWFIYSWAFNTVPSYPVLAVSADKIVAAVREVSIQSICDGPDDPIYPPNLEGSSVVVVDTDDFASLPNTLYAWGTPRDETICSGGRPTRRRTRPGQST